MQDAAGDQIKRLLRVSFLQSAAELVIFLTVDHLVHLRETRRGLIWWQERLTESETQICLRSSNCESLSREEQDVSLLTARTKTCFHVLWQERQHERRRRDTSQVKRKESDFRHHREISA